jgi:hypothetical protein
MVETGKDDLESLGTGLGYILKYAANVIRFPNRDEYKRIKTYSGFFKCNVEAMLHEPKSIFKLMGFTEEKQAGILILQPSSLPRVYDVAVDIVFAQEEILIIRKVQAMFTKIQLGLADVLVGRREVDRDGSDFAKTCSGAAMLCYQRKSAMDTESSDKSAAADVNVCTGGFEGGKEHKQKPDQLTLSLQDVQSSGWKSPVRSLSVGSTPATSMTTTEFEDMMSNLPAVMPSRKRVGPGASHTGLPYDDSDVQPLLLDSFVAKHAVSEQELDICEQNASNSALTGEIENATNEDDDSILYRSDSEHGDDAADLKSLIGRSKMHESDLTMPGQLPTDNRYQSQLQEKSRRQQPIADQCHAQSAQKGNKEKIGYTPELDTPNNHLRATSNRMAISDQVPALPNSAPPEISRELVCNNPVKERQLHSDGIHNRMSPVPPPRNSSKIVMQRNKRLSIESEQECYNKDLGPPGRDGVSETGAALRQSPPLQPEVLLPTSSKVAAQRNTQEHEEAEQQHLDKDSESFVTYSLDKNGTMKEGTYNVDEDRYVHTGEEIKLTDNGDVQRDCGEESTAVSNQYGQVVPDMGYTREREEQLRNQGRRGYEMTSASKTQQPSYASVAATPCRSESSGKRQGPGLAQQQKSSSWHCIHCTFINDNVDEVCQVCIKSRDFRLEDTERDAKKQCKHCTFYNPKEAQKCEVCEKPFDLMDLKSSLDDIVDQNSTLV